MSFFKRSHPFHLSLYTLMLTITPAHVAAARLPLYDGNIMACLEGFTGYHNYSTFEASDDLIRGPPYSNVYNMRDGELVLINSEKHRDQKFADECLCFGEIVFNDMRKAADQADSPDSPISGLKYCFRYCFSDTMTKRLLN